MVFLPEAFDYVAQDKKQSVAMAETTDGPTITRCAELARKYNVWLSLGAFHQKVPHSIYFCRSISFKGELHP